MYALARENVELGHEVPGPLVGPFPRAFAGAPQDGDCSIRGERAVVRRVALPEEHLAHFGRPDVPMFREQVQLLIGQLRKQCWVVVVQEGGSRSGSRAQRISFDGAAHTAPAVPLSSWRSACRKTRALVRAAGSGCPEVVHAAPSSRWSKALGQSI